MTAEPRRRLPVPVLCVLSAPDPQGLAVRAALVREQVRRLPEADLPDLAYSLAAADAGARHRVGLVVSSRAELLSALDDLAGGDVPAGLTRGVARPDAPLALVFPGSGSEWPGMAVALLDSSPVFRAEVELFAGALTPYLDWSVLDVLRGVPGAPELERPEVVQPTLTAVMAGIGALWRAAGVEPQAVIGYSLGEVPSAYFVGGLSVEDAARVVARWSREQGKHYGRGEMATVALGAADLDPYFAQRPGELFLAGVSGPHASVIAGEPDAVRALLTRLTEDGVWARRLPVGVAVHSPQMELIRESTRDALAPLSPRTSAIPRYSTVSGDALDTGLLDEDYWPHNLCSPVLFDPAVRRMLEHGYRFFVEVSPRPVLTMAMQDTFEQVGSDAVALGSLLKGDGDLARFRTAVAEAYVAGVAIDWDRHFAEHGARRLELPAVEDLAVAVPRQAPVAPAVVGFAQRLAGLSGLGRSRLVDDLVSTTAAAVLGLDDPAPIAPGSSFRDFGFDSLTGVRLRDRLNEETGLRLAVTAVFDHATPAALARHILGLLTGPDEHPAVGEPAAPAVGEPAAPARAASGHPDEPVAIIGMACRYPGGIESPAQLWRLLMADGDVISDWPTDRGWRHPSPTGATAPRGGFLTDPAGFDAEFFGISPREALAMDPQQRLLLETSWEAVEAAGLDPGALRGTRTGVFTGLSSRDYGGDLMNTRESARGHLLTGNIMSVASGRVSYALGMEGPAVTVDTACSSSLVALHLAAQSLRSGESDLALTGGATVMATPFIMLEFIRQDGLAADGRCKAFAGAADGTGLAEGVGVLVLKRLSDARRDGDRVLAVVRGSAINQDGASNGLSAPSGSAQRRVVLEALSRAGLRAADVDAVEAHGTGTRLGDPIEAEALIAAYGRDRDRPLLLGSLKSNIGHTQSAAGVGGVIKMILAMRHGVLPRTLHVDEPTPHVDWSAGDVRLLTEPTPWPATDRPRRAGVSAFGLSGTNAHVILEQAVDEAATEAATEPEPDVPVVPVVLSAATEPALRALAGRVASFMRESPEVPLRDIGFSLAGRAQLAHRHVITEPTREAVVHALTAFAEGEGGRVPAAERGGRLAVVFSGQGSEWVGMGRELYGAFPVFAEAFDEVCGVVDGLVGCCLRDVVFGAEISEGSAGFGGTLFVQLGLFAFEVALFRLVVSWGVVPGVVMGHSLGEVVAAHVAGVFGLVDAVRLVVARGRLMGGVGGGVMAVVGASEERVRDVLVEGVEIAAVNGPGSVVVSGVREGVEVVVEVVRGWGGRVRWLPVEHGFHSFLMDPVLEEFGGAVSGLRFDRPVLGVVSNVSGGFAGEELCSADYWVRHVREAVRFGDGVASAVGAGVSGFVELGPDGSLTSLIREQVPETVVASAGQRRGRSQVSTLLAAVAEQHVHGLTVNWRDYFGGSGQLVDIPAYPFQHEHYWLEPIASEGGSPESVADSWCYRETWRPVPASTRVPTGTWLVVLPEDEDGAEPHRAVLNALRRSAEVVTLAWNPATDLRGLADRLRAQPIVDGVVSLLGLDERPHPGHDVVPRGSAGTLALLQALSQAGVAAPMWCVTQAAVTTGSADTTINPVQAQIWGLGRVAALEHPRRWGGLVDLPADPDERAVRALLGVLGGAAGEDQFAIRGGGVLVRRLVRSAPPAAEPAWRPAGTVLITGGTGGLGGHLARWAARNGADHVVLLSRSGNAAPSAAALTGELAVVGVAVTVVAADVADRAAVAEVLGGLPELTTVVHAAGVAEFGPLEELTVAGFAAATAAKVDGARHLHELTKDRALDRFVLFSSGAAAWGGGTQGAYAAGNAYLDALAARRCLDGLPATSVAWGSWAGDGMIAQHGVAEALGRAGLRPLDPDLALDTLHRVLGADLAHLVVADIDWARFTTAFTASRPSPLIGDLPEVRAARRASSANPLVASWRHDTAALPEPARRAAIDAVVLAETSATLDRTSGDAVDENRAFKDLGFDSLMSVELRNRLVGITGLEVSPTLVFDHPTPRAIAAHLDSLLSGVETTTEVAAPVRADGELIAIVGMACRLPGAVDSPDELWDLLLAGRDVTGDFPADRGWDATGLGTSARGGFLADAAGFDADFFGISPREAAAMDPQQRLVLELAWETFERAGIDPSSLRGSQTGVFVGGNGQDWATLVQLSGQDPSGYALTGGSGSVLSGRVAYAFGLEGPAVTVDTACSSSLVGLHLAAQSLRSGESDLALAGGVTVMATPGAFVEFSRQGGLSGDGRCKPFAAAADGTGWAEGVGLVLLERLSDATRKGRRVLAVLRGSAVNQDGASNGLTAPNGLAQQRVIRAALANAGLSTGDVDAVEAHGTGTVLGDPIEAQAILATYGRDRDRPVLLGSLKSNVGHTQAAAGVAGVIKAVLALRDGVVPASLHVDAPTPHVDWSGGDAEVVTAAVPLPSLDRPWRAGVSSFGISGTNAHVIVEQAPPSPVTEPGGAAEDGMPLPFVVSAKTDEALRAAVTRLREFLVERPDVRLADVTWSLVSERAEMEHRAVVIASTREELLERLDRFDVQTGVAGRGGRLAVVFSGQGSEWVGMGRELYGAFPVFAEAFDEVCGVVDGLVGCCLRDVVFGVEGADGSAGFGGTLFVQLGLFAFEVALFRLVVSWGVVPGVVMGHSLGEVVAAHVAGVFGLVDAVRLVVARGRLMGGAGGGVMAVVGASEERVRDVLVEGVEIAAVNGPGSVVVSGVRDAVGVVVEVVRGWGGRVRWLPVEHGFHSFLMDPVLEEFGGAVSGLRFDRPVLGVVSNVSGGFAGEELCSADYWVRHVRGAVRFGDGVASAVGAGVSGFVELGPDGSLTSLIREQVPENVVASAGQRRGRSQVSTLLAAVAEQYVHGSGVDWARCLPEGSRSVELPTYPFQHRRYWPAPHSGTRSSQQESLFITDWVPLRTTPVSGPALRLAAIGEPPAAVGSITDTFPELAALADAVANGLPRPDAVLAHVVPDESGDVPVAARKTTEGVLVLLQSLLAEASLAGTTLVLVMPDPGPGRTDLICGTVRGLVRAAQAEHPGRFVLLTPGEQPLDEDVLTAALATGEPEIALRDGRPHAHRLIAAALPAGDAPAIDPRGTVLVTGATGGLGRVIARHLVVERGARRLLLVSRQGGEAPAAAQLEADLRALGAEVTIAACDVGDRSALGALLATIPDEHPLVGVVHAAGVLDDGTIESLDRTRLEPVLRPKADAAWHLHELTRHLDLALFVLYSSASATIGVAGQGNYAAANAFLDALARHRHASGLPAVALAWGPWARTDGMTGALDTTQLRRLSRLGAEMLTEAQGTALFDAAVRAGRPNLVPLRLSTVPRNDAVPSVLRALHDTAGTTDPVQTTDTAPPQAEPFADRLAALPPDRRHPAVVEFVRENVAAVLAHADPGGVAADRPFAELGFDSLTAVELRNRLAARTGLPLSSGLVFDYPTADALAGYLRSLLAPEETPATRVLHGIESLEAELAALGTTDESYPEISARLRSLVRGLTGRETDEVVKQDILAATTDEVLDFIDREFGDL